MKIARMVKWTFVIAITLAVAGVIAFVAMWGRKTEITQIRPGGPFGDRFSNLYGEGPGSMNEYRSERLEDWFRSVLPVGTDRAKCRDILKESFGADLTSGDFVVIDKMSVFPSGGEETKVRLIFDRDGRFQDVEVRQNRSWASVYPEPEPNTSWVATADMLPRSLRSVSPAPPCQHI
jgi:hypothetical protein